MNVLRLAWAHMRYHWKRTSLLAGCAFISFLLPILIPQLVRQIETELYSRAEAIPLVVGSDRCSPLDLTLHSLYFRGNDIPTIPFRYWQQLSTSHVGGLIPIHVRFQVRHENESYPIVGTQLDYLDELNLEMQAGRPFARLGDCVIGAEVARKMNLGVGDQLITSPESVVSLAAAYPVQLNITGVLKPSGSVEDQAVLTDIKTAWVIENLGHGHQDVSQSNDPNLVLERNDQGTVASAAVVPFTVINEDNIASFHFHGDIADFPISSILITSRQQRTQDLISGAAEREADLQAVATPNEVGRLLTVVFQVQWLLLAVILVVGLATLLLFALVVSLSVQIRSEEMQTMYKLGASRGFNLQLHVAEILSILIFSLTLAGFASMLLLNSISDQWFRWIV